MTSPDTLERRVADTLRAKAEQLAVDTRPFEPAVGPTLEPVTGRSRSPRRPRAWLMAGAAVAACLLLALWAYPGGDGGRARVVAGPPSTTTPPPTAGSGPDRVVGQSPSWVPAGLAPTSVSASHSTGAGVVGTQLFGDVAGTPRLFVQLQPGGGEPGSGQVTTVRGLPARAMPAKDFAATTTTVSWDEGANVSASFTGLSLAQAEALLATLQWASVDHLDGFVPAPTSSLHLLGQQLTTGSAPTTSSLDLTYADSVDHQQPGQGLQLTVRTTTAPGDPRGAGQVDAMTGSYLEAWFHGQRQPDGSVVSYDPAFHTLSLAWPDGRTAWIDANATAIDQAQLQQVADSLATVDQAGLRALVADVAHTLRTQLPLTAAARSGDVSIELRRGSATEAVCLQPAGASTWTCSAPAAVTSTEVAVSVLDGSRWLVAVAAATPVTVTAGQGLAPPRVSVPVHDVDEAGWHLALALPPRGVETVTVLAGNQGEGLTRPDR